MTEYGDHPLTPNDGGADLVLPARGAVALTGDSSLRHSGMSIDRFYAMHLPGAAFPLLAGLLLFGWRAVGALTVVLMSAALATFLWRRIAPLGAQLRFAHLMWMALLLGLMLPAHLFQAGTPGSATAPWPVLPAAGLALVIFTWLLGGAGSSRVHPVLLTFLLLVVLFGELLVPHHILHPRRLLLGDLLDATPTDNARQPIPWTRLAGVPADDALWREPAAQRLIFYTSGNQSPDRAWLSLEGLLRDRMPPLEDLIIGGHPAPIGGGSAVAAIIGGLFLLYRGLIDYRVPVLVCAGAVAALLLLPVPVVIRDAPQWHWAAFHVRGVGWATALTFVNYELMSGPLLFMALFLATAPAVRPMTRRGRAIYATLLGLLAGALQLYASVAFGPYLALLVVSLLTPLLDRWFAPRALVGQ